MAYKDTSVPVERSQSAIRILLYKYGTSGVQFTEEWKQRKVSVRFIHDFQGQTYQVRIEAKVPKVYYAGATALKKKEAQVERQIWRGLYWSIKSRMEAIDFGIESFVEAFLAHFEDPRTGRTIAEYLVPALAAGKLNLALSPPEKESNG